MTDPTQLSNNFHTSNYYWLWPKILECMHTALPADSAIVLSVVFHSTCSINQMPILILVLSPLLLHTHGNAYALSSTFTSILMLLP